MLKYMFIVKDAYEMRGTQAFHTYDQSFRLLHVFECTVGPVTHFVCVPDVTGTIPVSVVKKWLETPIYGGW
jgi:hypothetical protein